MTAKAAMGDPITFEDMGKALLMALPELAPQYKAYLEQWGDDAGDSPYILYDEVFRPYIIKLAEEGNFRLLGRALNFLETLIEQEDNEVQHVAFDIVRSIASWKPFLVERLRPLAGREVGALMDALGPYDRDTVRARIRWFRETNPEAWEIVKYSHVDQFGPEPDRWLDE